MAFDFKRKWNFDVPDRLATTDDLDNLPSGGVDATGVLAGRTPVADGAGGWEWEEVVAPQASSFSGDTNTLTTPGVYEIVGAGSNLPAAGFIGTVTVETGPTGSITQFATNGVRSFTRGGFGSVTGPWTEVLAGTAGLDDPVAALVANPASDTSVAVADAVAAGLVTAPRPVPAFKALKATLAAASVSTGIQVLGDSTGNEPTEWPRLMLADFAAARPALTFVERLWSDATQSYGTPTVIQTGTAGESYLLVETGKTSPVIPQAAAFTFPSTLDLRVKMAADDWSSPAANTVICGRENGAGQRSWWFQANSAGHLQMVVSSDGTALVTIASTIPAPLVDGATAWVRCVYDPDDGAGNRVTKFYTSADGQTWTQLGATVTTAGVLVPFNPTNAPLSIGGRAGASGLPGMIYEVWMLDGEDGPTMAPVLPSLWSWTTSVPRMTLAGAPVVTLVNGSHPGASLTYLGDAARIPKMTPHFGQAVTLLSDSHNDSKTIRGAFMAAYGAWASAASARVIAPLVLLTQNPQNPAATNSVEHGIRRLDTMAYGGNSRLDVIDIYQTFLDNPNWLAQWMADIIHPNALGQAAWWGAIKARYDAT